MSNNKLRIGLMLRSIETPAWIYKSISEIANSDISKLCLVVLSESPISVDDDTPVIQNSDIEGNWFNNRIRSTLYSIFSLLVDRRMYLKDANEPFDCRKLIVDIPRLYVTSDDYNQAFMFTDADLAEINSHNLDVLVHFDGAAPIGAILSTAKHGVWSICHSDYRVNRGNQPGYWESMQNWPVTGSVLRILSEASDNGKILSRSFSSTQRLSVRDNQNNYFWKSPALLTRNLRELHRLGGETFLRKVEKGNAPLSFFSSKVFGKPTNTELARHVFAKVLEKARLIIHDFFYFDQWILMFDFRGSLSTSLHEYRKLLPPKDKFWADPFIVEKDKKNFIFFEEYSNELEKGHISVLELLPDGNHSEPKIVLEKPYHLSYPFMFEFNGEQYMVPETSENRTIELYKCEDFPETWTYQHNLIEGINAFDATLFEHANRWWMFANVVETEGISSWDELFLFSSDSPLSCNWVPHPMNPIVSDCRTARPAGSIIRIGNRLFRPSQNSSHHYGYGLNFMEIEKISEQEYSEKLVSKILPEWDKTISGTHTFNKSDSLIVIDAIQVRRRR